jgi:serine-type D-Ala-D-Ala carboxypeptidase (penicillin-binding protein 5/6)
VKWILLLLIFLELFRPGYAYASPSFLEQQSNAEKPAIQSEAAILIDSRSGDVLYEKNSNEVLAPASITKIVTGIIALEHSNPDEDVIVSHNARYVDGTRVFLAEGEHKKLRELLYGLLMNSGNDAAVAIAEHIDGSTEAFSKRMNAFVASIGAVHTHFVNPNGLYDKEHVTTASDMAKIAAYAMKNNTFRTIVSTQVKPWSGQEWKSSLVNHNKMLSFYKGANGVKNGYTRQSGFTLVTSAERNGTELLAVIMKADTDRQIYKETAQLLDYGFAHYATVRALNTGENIVQGKESYYSNTVVYASIPKGDSFHVRIDKDKRLVVETKSGHIQRYASLLKKTTNDTAAANGLTNGKNDEEPQLVREGEIALGFGAILYTAWKANTIFRRRRI